MPTKCIHQLNVEEVAAVSDLHWDQQRKRSPSDSPRAKAIVECAPTIRFSNFRGYDNLSFWKYQDQNLTMEAVVSLINIGYFASIIRTCRLIIKKNRGWIKWLCMQEWYHTLMPVPSKISRRLSKLSFKVVTRSLISLFLSDLNSLKENEASSKWDITCYSWAFVGENHAFRLCFLSWLACSRRSFRVVDSWSIFLLTLGSGLSSM